MAKTVLVEYLEDTYCFLIEEKRNIRLVYETGKSTLFPRRDYGFICGDSPNKLAPGVRSITSTMW